MYSWVEVHRQYEQFVISMFLLVPAYSCATCMGMFNGYFEHLVWKICFIGWIVVHKNWRKCVKGVGQKTVEVGHPPLFTRLARIRQMMSLEELKPENATRCVQLKIILHWGDYLYSHFSILNSKSGSTNYGGRFLSFLVFFAFLWCVSILMRFGCWLWCCLVDNDHCIASVH